LTPLNRLLYFVDFLDELDRQFRRTPVLTRRPRASLASVIIAATLAIVLAACGSSSKSTTPAAKTSSQPVTLRLGYFPNVTHAPAIVGVESGRFQQALGSNVTLKLSTYNAGSDVVTAMLAGALDASFVGPNPAINSYQKTNGGVRVVSGTASGGAFLVVKPSINSAADLKGKKVASPQLGNTQDVALRTWLEDHGLNTTTTGGGDVSVIPQENSTTLTAFQAGRIDGAWVPEPWATRLVKEGGGKVLVDEATLWPQGKFTTTTLVVTKKFLDANPDVVQHLIQGLDDSIAYIKSNPTQAEQVVSTGIGKVTGKPLKTSLIAASFKSITFTLDPIASSLQTSADHAKALGLLKSSELGNIFDLTLANKVLKAKGEPEISAP
jgi:NitT/TauT family transport system substrate-binding protein